MLGNIVTELREANGWTMQELAERVQAAGAANVRYQHIQQLETKPNTSPRYIVELAAAFSKSVEELRNWMPGMAALGHHGGEAAHQIREDAPSFRAQPYSPAEMQLIAHFRQCSETERKALSILASSAAENHTRQHRPKAR